MKRVGSDNRQGRSQPSQFVQPAENPGRDQRNPPQSPVPEDRGHVRKLATKAGYPIPHPLFSRQEIFQYSFRFGAAATTGLFRCASIRPADKVFDIPTGLEFHRPAIAVAGFRTRLPERFETIPRIHDIPDAVVIHPHDIVHRLSVFRFRIWHQIMIVKPYKPLIDIIFTNGIRNLGKNWQN